KRTLPESLPTRKARGRQVPRRFVQDLAWRRCQLSSVPGFEQLGSIELHEEDDEEESGVALDDLGVFVFEDVEGEPLDQEEEDLTEKYMEGTRRFDEPTAAVDEPTKEINIGTEEEPKNVLISANLSPQEEAAIVSVLRNFLDGFAWSYEDMPGLSRDL